LPSLTAKALNASPPQRLKMGINSRGGVPSPSKPTAPSSAWENLLLSLGLMTLGSLYSHLILRVLASL